MFDRFQSKIIRAPEFPSNFDWINTTPITIDSLKGHVIVLDFWTYCCINCMHTLPVLADLEKKYEGKPVVFIGVHSAKFFNEQDKKNIEHAVRRYQISHPVIVDKQMNIWQKYDVAGWPTVIIIDPNGRVVYNQSGEGQKEMIEDTIDVILEKYSKSGGLAREPIKIDNRKVIDNSILSYPGKIAISNQKLAISDSNHNRIIVTDLTGKIEHIIGSGMTGLLDGTFEEARFFRPQGVAWKDNFIIVADTENHALRKIDLINREVFTIAGTGTQGSWISQDGKGTDTSLSSPWDVAIKDDLIFIAMAGNHQIWTCDLVTGLVKPYAGNGYENIVDGNRMQAQLAQPSGLSIFGNLLYFVDSETSSVREVDLQTNHVRTIVGRGLFVFGHQDGNAKEATFQHPLGLCSTGNRIYVADTYNSSIRMINLKNQEVFTIVGKEDMNTACSVNDPQCGFLGLYEPSDVKIFNEKLYIADTNNHLIQTYDLATKILNKIEIRF